MKETNLVILNNVPQMNLCQVCPKPGHCCQGFELSTPNASFWIEDEKKEERINKFLKEKDLPFEICGAIWPPFECGENKYTAWIFNCPKLTSEGRCSIYKTRPKVCQNYIPSRDTLCCFGLVDAFSGKISNPSK